MGSLAFGIVDVELRLQEWITRERICRLEEFTTANQSREAKAEKNYSETSREGECGNSHAACPRDHKLQQEIRTTGTKRQRHPVRQRFTKRRDLHG